MREGYDAQQVFQQGHQQGTVIDLHSSTLSEHSVKA
jgi:hypothetical protein